MPAPIKLYTKALFEAAQNLSKSEIKTLVENWLKALSSKNLLSKVPAAVSELQRLDDAAEGIVRAEIITARKLARTTLEEIEKIVMKRTGGKKIIWQEIIDASILGGAVVKYGDTILDISLKQAVAELTFEISK